MREKWYVGLLLAFAFEEGVLWNKLRFKPVFRVYQVSERSFFFSDREEHWNN